MKRSLLIFLLLTSAGSAFADVVYVTARPSPCTVTANCPGPNLDGTYSEQNIGLGDFGAVGSAPGHPQTTVARTYIGTPPITDPTAGVTLTPTLGVPGGTYQIDYNFNSLAGNTTTNLILAVNCTAGGTLSFSTTDKFQRSFGSPANQWQFLGYLTNNAGGATPTIEFHYQSGEVSGATQNRLLFDCWRFTLVQPCLAIPVVNVVGPLGTNSNQVVVAGVSASATNVTVYQNSGGGMVQIGIKTNGVTAGNNTVTISGLVKNAQVAATQTINGQAGCVPASGTLVGGGANPRVRIALTLRETATTSATVGAPGSTASGNLHFVGATMVGSGTAPVDAPVYYPSNGWQTVTFNLRETAGNAANALGAATANAGYAPNDSVAIQVYAFRTVVANGTLIYSRVGAQSAAVTSNNVFAVNWRWDAVPGADGYRLLRNVNQAGYNEGADVSGTNFFADLNDSWFAGTTITPTSTQTGPSIQWNPATGNMNNLPGQWGALESINFAIDDLTDTGPYDLYIDNIQNGTTVFQTFEEAAAGTTDYGFRAPSFSGTTSGNLLPAPNVGAVSNGAADSGTKSFRVQFQWNGLTVSRWLRLTTSGVAPASNPYVNLDDPISFRLLLQPVGVTPVAPPAPTLSINLLGNQPVLNWTGGHRLQTAPIVTGPYTNIPNAILAPYTNTFLDPARFFRLVD